MAESRWVSREKKMASGRIIRWRERRRADGSIDRVFEDEGYERVSGVPQPLTAKAA